ncbi:hypothetical protein ACFYNY_29410 [Streptomyces sp. NPDC006530]|uniref:hypothetical protein n=1 Tax=Streptomyces sp. NPDC006530 TaxID=3364750 RepID=UPI00367D2F85
MGSLRNPVGPLPSSIYWRRRAVALSLIALLAILVLWFATSGGGGSKGGTSKGPNPTQSITPGPTGSGPAISTAPGGRDESSGSGGSGGSGGSAGSAGSGGPGGSGGANSADGGTSTGSGGAGGSDSGSGGGSSGGDGEGRNRVPAGSPLPICAPGSLSLTLRSTKTTFGPGEKPRIEVVLKNNSASTCKADLGPKGAVVTVTSTGNDRVWSTDDCLSGDPALFFQVPGGATITHAVEWDRSKSAPGCATPPAGAVTPGTYLLEAHFPGLPVARASFALAKD